LCDGLRRRKLKDCLDLIKINPYPMLRNNETKKESMLDKENTFMGI